MQLLRRAFVEDAIGLPDEPAGSSMTYRIEREDAQEDSAVEWWFIQGELRSHDSSPCPFMASLFRFRLTSDEHHPCNGFQLLVAKLDAERKHHSATWVDPLLREKAVAELKSKESPLDPTVQQAMAWEIERFGPPAPILLKARPGTFQASPLKIEWDEFALRQEGSRMHLCLPHLGEGGVLNLELEARAPRMEVACQSTASPIGSGMAYQAYPRLRIVGTDESGESVSGEAWLDHQWGDSSWFCESETKTLLGWDWFGLNLDDGSDWLIMCHREAKSGRILGLHATARDLSGTVRVCHDLSMEPHRFWRSPRTHIDYPVAWSISIPALEAEFQFDPLADDQELASFDASRGVWEGAGVVSGRVQGRTICGRARGEFQGYGYIFNHREFVARIGDRVDAQLEQFLPRNFDDSNVERFVGPAMWEHVPAAYTAALSTPVWDLIDRSGKRWRPIFGILMLEALGRPSRPFEGLICVMTELIHAGALIVDDIEDESELRRGQPALHLRYGVDIALNAGNALYFLPAVALMDHPLLSPEKRLAIHEIKERVCIQAHCGQATDIYWSRNLSAEELRERLRGDIEKRILQMYAFKTAAASSGVAEVASVVADASADCRKSARDFGQAIGVAYQIIDDIHNFSRSPNWTKTTGEDIATGKLTYVVATALRRLDPVSTARLGEILCSPELRRQAEVLAEGVELVRASGALEECHQDAMRIMDDGWKLFANGLPSSEPKIMLHAMCKTLIDLAFDG